MSGLRELFSNVYRKISILCEGMSCFSGDLRYFTHNANLDSKNRSRESSCSALTASYHIIEKGLSMPNRRLGFGGERLAYLIDKCSSYYNEYGMDSQLAYALSIIKEYDVLHKTEGYKLDLELQCKIDSLLNRFPNSIPAVQHVFTKDQYFSKTNAPFDEFSASRHSMRHFGGCVTIEQIEQAVDLAKNAPSACNKQPVRVYVISEENKKKIVLDMQQGNRGFGQNIDKVLIITTQFSGCTRFSERYMPFMDAGIFSMNLLYSLHFYHIGAIPLVWLNSKTRDRALRELVGIPEREIPALVIGVGDVTDSIVCALSPRLETDKILK